MKKPDNTLLLILGAAVIGGGAYLYYKPGPAPTFVDSKGRTWHYGPPDKKVEFKGQVYGGQGKYVLPITTEAAAKVFANGTYIEGAFIDFPTFEALKAAVEKAP